MSVAKRHAISQHQSMTSIHQYISYKHISYRGSGCRDQVFFLGELTSSAHQIWGSATRRSFLLRFGSGIILWGKLSNAPFGVREFFFLSRYTQEWLNSGSCGIGV